MSRIGKRGLALVIAAMAIGAGVFKMLSPLSYSAEPVEGRVVDRGRRDEARDGLERRYERAVAESMENP